MTFIEVVSDVENITLDHPSGNSKVNISTFGATVTSWKIFNNEMLFLSKTAELDGSRPIRGGIPIVFPQFGPGELKQHGFARESIWQHVKTFEDPTSAEICALFRLTPNDEIRAMWDYKFELLYEIRLGLTNLLCSLSVINHDERPIPFTALFHNYFAISDFDKANVTGLCNFPFIDKTKPITSSQHTNVDTNPVIMFDGEVDRIYTRPAHSVTDRTKPHSILSVGDGGNADVVVATVNLNDVVVWNPGQEKAATITDLHKNGYQEFVCLETGEVTTPLLLPPGKTWAAGQRLTLRILSSVSNKIRQEIAASSYPKMERIGGVKK